MLLKVASDGIGTSYYCGIARSAQASFEAGDSRAFHKSVKQLLPPKSRFYPAVAKRGVLATGPCEAREFVLDHFPELTSGTIEDPGALLEAHDDLCRLCFRSGITVNEEDLRVLEEYFARLSPQKKG